MTTDEKIRKLAAGGLGWKAIGAEIGLHRSAVLRRANKMGLKYDRAKAAQPRLDSGQKLNEGDFRRLLAKLSQGERSAYDALIRNGYTRAQALGTIGRHDMAMQVPSPGKSSAWTLSELAYIRENYGTMSDEAMAARLGRTRNAIEQVRRRELRIIRENEISSSDTMPRPRKPRGITRAQVRWAAENFHHEKEAIREEARLIARIIADRRTAA